MKKYTECDIVRELLPLYIEQKTGKESNELIDSHLSGCAECREIYRWMSADLMEQEVGKEIAEEQRRKEASGRKKGKRKHLTYAVKCWLALGVGLLAYVGLLGGIVVYFFYNVTWGIF